MEYKLHTLNNGIRIVHKQLRAQVAHAGVMIHTGSRDELEEEQGLAHFIEHVFFKGTTKRKAYHVISRMEDVGGELNAYTAKEETCIYTSFMKGYYERSLELFSDILFNSVFPEKELLREKEVILDEINSYKDSPSELIFDDFEELVYPDHSLGKNILGTPKHLKSFDKGMINSFLHRSYHTDEIIICSYGDIDFDRLVKYSQRYFESIPAHYRENGRNTYSGYEPTLKRVNKNTYQSHCIIGNVAYNVQDDRRTGLFLLNNILGGPGMNSRLNFSLREKYGYAYNVESTYTPYSDTGLISIYFGTDNNLLEKSLKIIYKEIKKLQSKKLGILQLSKAKKQLIGQLAIGNESHINQLLGMAKSILIFDSCDSQEELIQKINAITDAELLEIANEVLDISKMSTLIYE